MKELYKSCISKENLFQIVLNLNVTTLSIPIHRIIIELLLITCKHFITLLPVIR